MRAKPDSKIIFISDSLPLNQASSASIIFGGQRIFKKDDKAVNSDGTLAGSLVFLDSAFRNLFAAGIIDLAKFLKFASLNVAQHLRMNDLGYIGKNQTADLVLWDEKKNFQVNTTIINGQIAFRLQ